MENAYHYLPLLRLLRKMSATNLLKKSLAHLRSASGNKLLNAMLRKLVLFQLACNAKKELQSGAKNGASGLVNLLNVLHQ